MASVLVPLAPGCEELEAVTLIDLLRRAGITVVTVGLTPTREPVTASRGTVLLPDTTLDAVLADMAADDGPGDIDMIVLPGGQPGADHLRDDKRIQTLLKRLHAQNKYIAAICAAPRALAHVGLLEGRRATSFPGAIEPATIPGLNYSTDPVVIDGRLITSRGPGTAMDFALSLIEVLLGPAKRAEVEAPLQRPTPSC